MFNSFLVKVQNFMWDSEVNDTMSVFFGKHWDNSNSSGFIIDGHLGRLLSNKPKHPIAG
jgi:hypothetical protein